MSYEITDWDEKYENAETRKRKTLFWVLVPNCHDGLGYCSIMARENALEIFGAWILILQVASKTSHRGSLKSSKGRPYTANEIATMTRAPVDSISDALDVLVEIGWITAGTSGHSPGVSASRSAKSGNNSGATRTKKEREKEKKKENPKPQGEKEGVGESGIEIPSPLCDDAAFMETWDAWCRHHAQMKNRRFTLEAQAQQLQHLATLSPSDAKTSLCDAMMKTWQGPAKVNHSDKGRGSAGEKKPARVVANTADVSDAIEAMKEAAS